MPKPDTRQQKLKVPFSGNGETMGTLRHDFSSPDSGNPSGSRPNQPSDGRRPAKSSPDSGKPTENM